MSTPAPSHAPGLPPPLPTTQNPEPENYQHRALHENRDLRYKHYKILGILDQCYSTLFPAPMLQQRQLGRLCTNNLPKSDGHVGRTDVNCLESRPVTPELNSSEPAEDNAGICLVSAASRLARAFRKIQAGSASGIQITAGNTAVAGALLISSTLTPKNLPF